MPRTLECWDYPLCRLFLKVGIALQSYLKDLPRVQGREERIQLSRRIEAHLGLDEAVADGLLSRHRIRWTDDGHLQTIRLIPVRRLRDTPGLRMLRLMFFPDATYYLRRERPRPNAGYRGNPDSALH